MTAHPSDSNDARFDFASYADRLMAAGDALAEKLRDIDSSPWTEQVLEEWSEAKDIRGWLPEKSAG